jgi:hypothetical protein
MDDAQDSHLFERFWSLKTHGDPSIARATRNPGLQGILTRHVANRGRIGSKWADLLWVRDAAPLL